jgi:hypothetical protein
MRFRVKVLMQLELVPESDLAFATLQNLVFVEGGQFNVALEFLLVFETLLAITAVVLLVEETKPTALTVIVLAVNIRSMSLVHDGLSSNWRGRRFE